ncbi:MAG: exo-alpha-sialidase [Acidobacteria bacterium]|nr:exo-alpha-sialidase [Acidobacteriota bacterium]
MSHPTRRHFSALLIGSVALRAQAPPAASIIPMGGGYSGWPTVARRSNGELLLAFSGDREAHVCPFGRVKWAVSRDEGRSWSWPRVLMDSAIDNRDAGVVETGGGALLVTTFTSLAYETVFERARADGFKGWSPDKVERWEAAGRRVSAAARKFWLGCWMLRSTDGGVSWSAPHRVPVNSPHGPAALADGRMLYAGKDLWGGGAVGVCESADDGASWKWLAKIPARPGDSVDFYHELHVVEAKNGHLIAQIRNENAQNRNETLQSESVDGGKTWSVPHSIGVWGVPSHLLRLRDGRLVMTYGYRRAPFGNEARISTDSGATWSEPIKVSEDGTRTDLGYPSTVELTDGGLLTVWYEVRPESPQSVLRMARWKI